MILTSAEITGALADLGLEKDDSVIVHSSFRSLGEVDGGPEAVIDAILSAIGPRGNLVLPAFNYTRPVPRPHFDPAETPARTGIIPEMGRKRACALRSTHPTHSVAVIGPDAQYLTNEHMQYRTFGVGSPIDRLAKMGGKVLLLGVDHTSNSTIHVAEDYAEIPKVSWYDDLPYVKVLMPDGSFVKHRIDTSPTCSAGFAGVEYALRKHAEIRDIRIGPSKVQLMYGEDVIRRAVEIMHEKADILLCTWSGCATCSGTRNNLRRMGRI